MAAETLPSRLTNPVAEFVGGLKLAEDSGVVFDVARNKMRFQEDAVADEKDRKERWQLATKDAMTSLTAEMEKLEAKLAKKSKSPPTTHRVRDWMTIRTTVEKAADDFQNRPKGGKIIKYFRMLSDNSTVLQDWLSILPAGDYGSIITGVFGLATTAAGSISDTRDGVYEALATIPEMMEMAKVHFDLYRRYRFPPLENAMMGLYVSILKTYAEIVKFLRENAFTTFGKAIFMQSQYGKKFANGIADVKLQMQNIEKNASLCNQGRVLRIGERQEEIASNQVEMFNEQKETDNQRWHDFQSTMEQLPKQTARETTKAITQYLYNMFGSNPDYDYRNGTLNQDYLKRLEALENAQLRRNQLAIEAPPMSREPSTKKATSTRQLLKALNCDQSQVASDIQSCIDYGYELPEATKNCASTLFRTDAFQTWLSGDVLSTALLVNGASDVESNDAISSLSYLLARFVDTTKTTKSILSLSYFCGLHTNTDTSSFQTTPDTSSSPQGMMKSLLAQIIWQVKAKKIPMDVSFVTEEQLQKLAGDGDVRTIYDVLKGCFMQLPRETILFCIIDSISSFESSDFRDQIVSVVRQIRRLTLVHNKNNCAFKLLCSCPGWSTAVYEVFKPGQVVEIENDDVNEETLIVL